MLTLDRIRYVFHNALYQAYLTLKGRGRPVHPIDRKLGIETSQSVSRLSLATGSEADRNSVGYVGATPSIIRKCFDVIGIGPDAEIIDLGCGKGRAVIVAAEYPFRLITGIELSGIVCDLARRNIAKLPMEIRAERISVVQGDASMPTLSHAPATVMFLYNSFRRPLVVKLAQHLECELARDPHRVVWLIYYNPVCFDVFDASPLLTRHFAAKIDFEEDERASAPTGNTHDSVIIYRAGPDPRPPLPGAHSKVLITIPDLGAEVCSSFLM